MDTLPFRGVPSLSCTRRRVHTSFEPSPHRTTFFYNHSLPKSLFPSPNFPLLPRHRALHFVAKSSNHHHHHHDHDDHQLDGHHHQHRHHDHGHGHHHGSGSTLSGSQESFLRIAKAIRWTDLADFLRENLHLCCCSTALFLAAAVCPYLIPKPAVKPLQNAFIFVAFPLVGVSFVFCFLVFGC